jgi:hypothetical protein
VSAFLLFLIGLLLMGVCLHVGFDMPWKVALFPCYAPPIVIGAGFLVFKFFRLI